MNPLRSLPVLLSVLLMLVSACTQPGTVAYTGYDAAPDENPGWEAPTPDGWGCGSATVGADLLCNDDDGDVFCQAGLWSSNNKAAPAEILPCNQAILCPPLQPATADHPACQPD